jgi:hypothetical protein
MAVTVARVAQRSLCSEALLRARDLMSNSLGCESPRKVLEVGQSTVLEQAVHVSDDFIRGWLRNAFDDLADTAWAGGVGNNAATALDDAAGSDNENKRRDEIRDKGTLEPGCGESRGGESVRGGGRGGGGRTETEHGELGGSHEASEGCRCIEAFHGTVSVLDVAREVDQKMYGRGENGNIQDGSWRWRGRRGVHLGSRERAALWRSRVSGDEQLSAVQLDWDSSQNL